MQVQILQKKDVARDVESFKQLINPFCEQYHFEHRHEIKHYEVCKKMVELFKDDFSDGFVRHNIDEYWKVGWRIRNAKKKGESKEVRLKKTIDDAQNELVMLTYQAILSTRK